MSDGQQHLSAGVTDVPTEARLRPEPAWSTATGHSRLAAVPPSSPDPALDRILVAERVHRYGWSYDERRRDDLGGCFLEDGVWEGSIMGQERVGPFEGREAVVEFLTGFWDIQDDQRRHVFTNVVTQEVTGDTAVAHAYLILLASSDATMTPVTAGPYRFELTRSEGVWLIARLSAGFDAPF